MKPFVELHSQTSSQPCFAYATIRMPGLQSQKMYTYPKSIHRRFSVESAQRDGKESVG